MAFDLHPSLLASISTAYGLHGARLVERLESYGNDNWLVADASGRLFVLRRQHLNAAAERIRFQLELQQHIAVRGLPTPRQLPTLAREYFVPDESGVPWLLFAHADGDGYDFARIDQVRAAGRTLARFHDACALLPADGPPPEYRSSILDCWARADAHMAELTTMFAGDAARDALAHLKGQWRDVREDWPFERVAALPRGWVHGDYHGRNMVFVGDEVAAVFDFDDVDRDPYICDVAGGVLKFGRRSRGSLELRPAFAAAFVAGYEAIRPLSPEEHAALPVMLAMGHPPHPHNLRYWRDRRGVHDASRLLREVEIMRALQAATDALAPDLTACHASLN